MRMLKLEPRTAEERAAWQLEDETQAILRRMRRLGARTMTEYIALCCAICQVRHRPDNPNHLAPSCVFCRHRHWFAVDHYCGDRVQRCRFIPSRTNAYGEVVLCDYWEPPVQEEEAEKRRLWARSKAQWSAEQARALVHNMHTETKSSYDKRGG